MHKAPDGRPNQDCTAWGPIAPAPNASTAMGTLDQLRHLVLANARYCKQHKNLPSQWASACTDMRRQSWW